jgi:hypothetical protein
MDPESAQQGVLFLQTDQDEPFHMEKLFDSTYRGTFEKILSSRRRRGRRRKRDDLFGRNAQ